MDLGTDAAELFVPDGTQEAAALGRTTHLGIGAHQDDLEIMAIDGILQSYEREDAWFTGVVVTDGRGAPRAGLHADSSDEEMVLVRAEEQKKAAAVGKYSAQVLLGFPSEAVKNGAEQGPVEALTELLKRCRPQVVYTHSLMDKHDSHVGVAMKTIAAIRALPTELRPAKLYGCEVWRDLDWLRYDDKVSFDCSDLVPLQMELLGAFQSQIAGGKRYDLAVMGRRRAHATFSESHRVDEADGMTFGVDMGPLMEDDALGIDAFAQSIIRRFSDDVRDRIGRMS